MTIKHSCKNEKTCGKCGKKIYRFETRNNRKNGGTVHLRGQCPNVMNRPPGTSNPVPGKDSIRYDNRKFPLFIGILIAIILIVAGVK